MDVTHRGSCYSVCLHPTTWLTSHHVTNIPPRDYENYALRLVLQGVFTRRHVAIRTTHSQLCYGACLHPITWLREPHTTPEPLVLQSMLISHHVTNIPPRDWENHTDTPTRVTERVYTWHRTSARLTREPHTYLHTSLLLQSVFTLDTAPPPDWPGNRIPTSTRPSCYRACLHLTPHHRQTDQGTAYLPPHVPPVTERVYTWHRTTARLTREPHTYLHTSLLLQSVFTLDTAPPPDWPGNRIPTSARHSCYRACLHPTSCERHLW